MWLLLQGRELFMGVLRRFDFVVRKKQRWWYFSWVFSWLIERRAIEWSWGRRREEGIECIDTLLRNECLRDLNKT